MGIEGRGWSALGAWLIVVMAAGSAAAQPTPLLQLDRLSALAARAIDVVDVTVDPAMLQQAAGLLSGQQSDQAAVKALLARLKGVYVKSFKFDREGAYADSDVESVRGQLTAPWTRLVNVQMRKSRESVEVYLFQEGDRPGGLAILAAQPKELTVVNIVGPIDLSQLGALRGKLGIPQDLGIPGAPAGARPDAAAPKPE